MLWAILAFVGAVLDAGYYALAKRFLASVADEVLAAGAFLATSALLLLISFAKGVPEISPALIQPVLITGTINIIAAALVFFTLRRTDLSLAVPIITFTLVFLMGSSYLVLGEVPTVARDGRNPPHRLRGILHPGVSGQVRALVSLGRGTLEGNRDHARGGLPLQPLPPL